MISIQTILLLSIGITLIAAYDDPDCTSCEYINDVGYVLSPESCTVYYKCLRVKNGYSWYPQCCPANMTFNVDRLSCVSAPGCNDPREKCPPVIPIVSDESKPCPIDYLECAAGLVWDKNVCSCVRINDFVFEPCDKILHFDFTDSYDSDSCNNFASGVPQGNPPPSLAEDLLFLNGADQYLEIPYLNNLFLDTSLRQSFTLCFWFEAEVSNQTAGLFATTCDDELSIEIILDNDELGVNVGVQEFRFGVNTFTSYINKLCLTVSNSRTGVFFNGNSVGNIVPSVFSALTDSHTYTTLGYNPSLANFNGVMDDFCVYTKELDAQEIFACYERGPSNSRPVELYYL